MRERVPHRVMHLAFVLGAFCASTFHTFGLPPPARPYAPAHSDAGTFEERERAALLGRLLFKNITATFEETPINDVLKVFSDQIGATVIARCASERQPSGIDPQTTITGKFTNHPAKSALEEIVTQCADSGDCTWQLRKGFIEVSTKERLSVSAAREMRIYHVRDLMLEAPDFVKLDGRRSDHQPRKSPEQIAAELFSAIIDTVEPEAWEPSDEAPPAGPERAVPGDRKRNSPPPPVNTRGKYDPKNAERWVKHVQIGGTLHIRGKWGSMRLFRDQLIVTAPDFIQRQINGYPAAIEPNNSPVQQPSAALVLRAAPPSAPEAPPAPDKMANSTP
jgi:hypothetical protein